MYQIHSHSKPSQISDRKCQFGHPQNISDQTRTRPHSYHLLLASFRGHHRLEVIHSSQCFGYVLECGPNNSDCDRISFQNVLYKAGSVTRSEKWQCYGVTRVSSVCERLTSICGYWCSHMKPTVWIPGIHPPSKTMVLTARLCNSLEKADISNPLDRYFGRPRDNSHDHLTYREYSCL
jgi:hypothetical protein